MLPPSTQDTHCVIADNVNINIHLLLRERIYQPSQSHESAHNEK